MVRCLGTLLGVAFLLVVSASSAVAARSQSQPTRALDQSFVCTTSLVGGIREIEVRAHRGVREAGSRRWKQLPFGFVSTSTSARSGDLGNAVAYVTAGSPSSETTVGEEFNTAEVREWGTIARSTSLCRPTKAVVPIGSRGLQGGPAGAFGDEYDCPVARRVLVRIRATMRAPTRLVARQGLARTSVPAVEAQLMVRAQSGKPLAFVEARQSGDARLFVARTCVRE